jgi:hypothetical protein
MANTKPSAFVTKTTAYLDTKLMSQVPGNSAAAEDCQFTLNAVLTLFKANGLLAGKILSGTFPGSTSGEIEVPANALVQQIVVQSSGAGSIDIGTTGGGTEIVDGLTYPTAPNPFVMNYEFGSGGGTLHFTGHDDTVTVKVIYIQL